MKSGIDNNEKIKELIREYQVKGGDTLFYQIMKEVRALKQYSINKIQRPDGITKRELEHECDIALYKAVMLYDTSRASKVTNYIINAMTRAMIEYVRETQSCIHISHSRLYKNAIIRKFINEYEVKHGETPDEKTICMNLISKDICENDIEQYNNTSNMFYHIDLIDVQDELIVYDEPDIGEDEEMSKYVEKLMSYAKPKERELLFKIYFENKSLSDVARELNCSRENIRQKHNLAINRIKKELEKRKEN